VTTAAVVVVVEVVVVNIIIIIKRGGRRDSTTLSTGVGRARLAGEGEKTKMRCARPEQCTGAAGAGGSSFSALVVALAARRRPRQLREPSSTRRFSS